MKHEPIILGATKYIKAGAHVEFTRFGVDDTICIMIMREGEPGPEARASVNLGNTIIPLEILQSDHTFIKDYSENEGVLMALLDAGVVSDTGHAIPSGFELCPLCKINPDYLDRIPPIHGGDDE